MEEIKDCNADALKILHHGLVLRYSFVYSDQSIWIKPYRNTRGIAKIPAFEVGFGSHLYQFYANDIKTLIKECEHGTKQAGH